MYRQNDYQKGLQPLLQTPEEPAHYKWAGGKWVSWCCGRKICPTGSDINNTLGYLAELHDSGLQYETAGSQRSKISAFHDQIDGIKYGRGF